MTTVMGKLRSRLFMPDPSEVTLEKRGFRPTGPEQRRLLEQVGTHFLLGLSAGLEVSNLAEAVHRLEAVERQFRGFSYEGCTMGLAIRDSLSLRPHWVRDFIAGPAREHVYMAEIGVGWAMARIPRVRWRAVAPPDQLLRWLALDGLGFYQAYFRTAQYVDQQYQPPGYPAWEGPTGYAHRAVDQGIGRALWFVNGAEPTLVAASIGRFAPARQTDLWSGAGLASVYAGGVDVGGLETFWRAARQYQPQVAQGAAFAAKTRLRTGLVLPHTETAVKVYTGMSIEDAAAVTDEALVGLPPDGAEPAYEVWRRRIQDRFR